MAKDEEVEWRRMRRFVDNRVRVGIGRVTRRYKSFNSK